MMKKHFLSVALILIAFTNMAQLNVGINTSNWGGVSNTTWNPAISDSKYAVDISLGSLNSGFNQNYKGLAASAPFQNISFGEIFGLDAINMGLFNDGSLTKSLNSTGKPVNLNQIMQLEGPGSFLLPFGKNKNAIAVSYHFNVARSIVGVDPQLGFFSENSTSASNTGSNSFTIANAAWFDYDITYGRTVYDKGKHFFKLGVTLKIIHEMEASATQASLDNYSIQSGSLTVGSGTINSTYNKGTQISAAADIGFVYEYRPKKESYRYDIDSFSQLLPKHKNLYMLAVGFSVMDMGALPNSNPQSSYTGNISGFYQPSDFDVFSKAPLNNLVSKNSTGTSTGRSSIGLPTRFNLYIDYNTKLGLGVNLSTTISPVFVKSNPQIAYGSNISLTPRYELPLFGFYLPISYQFNGYPAVGAALRGGPVWVGVSDFIGMARSSGMHNTMFYAAVKIPIIFHRKYDKDGDKVSDRYDLCEYEKGSWATHGCIDKDGDGVRDSEDQCPQQHGPAYTFGCPDTDGDSIADKNDSCPSVKGPKALNGCPDTDGDGIADKFDDCPTQKGLKELNGCMDTDGDGISDKSDNCPTLKGDKDHQGCPDSDGDLVYDNTDLCPQDAGPKENSGCPWQDSDGDGILDKDDLCPNQKGEAQYRGCPTPTHKPLGSQMISLYDSLLFESGKADLGQANQQRVKSFAHRMLNENQNYNIILIGHTDNTEADSTTLVRLSVQRAEAVRQALISAGVQQQRITVDGYGAAQPAVSNSSPILRKYNRRVQLYIEVVGE